MSQAASPSLAGPEVSPPAGAQLLGPRTQKIAVVLLLIYGLQVWLTAGRSFAGHNQPFRAVAIILLICAIPPLARLLYAGVSGLRNFVGRYPNLCSVIVGLLVMWFLWSSARVQGVDNIPKWNDEFSYLIQTHILARGRLWMPMHPLWKFFDSLYVINDPVYTSMYFPGTALMLLPEVWLGLSKMSMPIFISAAAAGVFFRIVVEIVDGAWAVVATLMLLAIGVYRLVSTMVLSQGPMLLLAMVMVLAYLRWRGGGYKRRWLVVLGIASGWAAVTRPADALAYASVIGIAIAWQLRKKPWKMWLAVAAVVCACAAPFLAMQLVLNQRVTGHWTQTPYTYWLSREFPGTQFGFHAPPANARPISDTPQIYQAYIRRNVAAVEEHRLNRVWTRLINERLPYLWVEGVTSPLYWIFVPMAFAALFGGRGRILLAALVMEYFIYTWFVAFNSYYAVPIMPAVVLFLLCGIRAVSVPFEKRKFQIETAMLLIGGTLCVLTYPQFNALTRDDWWVWTEMKQVEIDLATKIQPPAVVLFHFHPDVNTTDIEPAYNYSVANPDDAAIVRANDRNHNDAQLKTSSDQNRLLYDYYARIQPQRRIYLYDRTEPTPTIEYLGTAAELSSTIPSK